MTYLSTREAADYLRRTPASIRNLVLRRQIPFRKVGGRLLFIKEELDKWVQESEGTSVEEWIEGRETREGMFEERSPRL